VNFSALQTQRKQLFITPGFLSISLKTAGSQLKKLIDDCMSVLVPIAHNAHHHNESDICSGILFFNDECIANMHHIILIGRL
jgi:hypothetical protein